MLSLLREGLTNQQIAERLGISLPGARYHVSEILSKLGVSSRQEAAELSAAGATSRPRWAYGLLAAPFQKLASLGLAKGVAAGALLAAGAGVLLLALGVFTMSHRGTRLRSRRYAISRVRRTRVRSARWPSYRTATSG